MLNCNEEHNNALISRRDSDDMEKVTDRPDKVPPEGRITRSPAEIVRVMEALVARQEPIRSHLRGGDLQFVSRLCYVDPDGQHIVIEASSVEAANVELLERARCTFFTDPARWHVEFVASAPERIMLYEKPAIRLGFPDVLSNTDKRAHARATGSPTVRLHCIADEGGVISFESWVVDVTIDGIGFLTYDRNITLEPGTLLKACRIEPERMEPVVVDLEVRYSALVPLPNGARAMRSGCRFVNPPATLKQVIDRFRKPPAA